MGSFRAATLAGELELVAARIGVGVMSERKIQPVRLTERRSTVPGSQVTKAVTGGNRPERLATRARGYCVGSSVVSRSIFDNCVLRDPLTPQPLASWGSGGSPRRIHQTRRDG